MVLLSSSTTIVHYFGLIILYSEFHFNLVKTKSIVNSFNKTNIPYLCFILLYEITFLS